MTGLTLGMLHQSMQPFDAVSFRETALAVKHVEDWSRVRSPARARRRMRLGHRQNVVVVAEPTCYEIKVGSRREMLIHPLLAAKLRVTLDARSHDLLRKTLLGEYPR